jgi:shikimate-5-dehydrogenase
VLSPISHPLLPNPSAPGQISFVESQSILYLLGLLEPRKFYLFGNPIGHSMSPTLHATCFSTLNLPHSYELHETTTTEELIDTINGPAFGGASVTIPYKRDIMPYLQHISKDARIIGAVNTITHKSGGLYGENTDWRAIKTCILRSLSLSNAITSETTALILGAGGTGRAAIYALYRIGVVNIYLYNRTPPRAQQLVDEFSKLDSLLKIVALSTLKEPLPIHPMPAIIISTIPATSCSASDGTINVDVGLKKEHLSTAGGVAIEMAYHPRSTKLLDLAEECRGKGWVGVEGIELLLEQGYEQFRIWTGRRAPKKVVREKVLEAYTHSN